MILGQAEGGMKVTLFRVNEIDKNNLSVAQLNEYYFKTMHHEFTHILNQKKPMIHHTIVYRNPTT